MSKYNVNDVFLDLKTGDIQPKEILANPIYTSNGDSAVLVYTNETFEKNTFLRVLLYPSGYFSEIAEFENLIAFNNSADSINQEDHLYCYDRYFINSSGLNYTFKPILPEDQNTPYQVGSMVFLFEGEEGSTDSISEHYYQPGSGTFITNFTYPKPSNIHVTARLSSDIIDQSNINIDIFRRLGAPGAFYGSELKNYDLQNCYYLTIQEQGTDNNYDENGNIISEPYDRDFETMAWPASGISLTLPYKVGEEQQRIYNINLWYKNTANEETNKLKFSTEEINKTLDEIYDEYTVFDKNKLNKTNNFIPIGEELLKKRRCSIGIYDVSLVQEVFSNIGYFISEYYTTENPIYSLYIKTRELNVRNYNHVKYYIEFNDGEWVRISPVNRVKETDDEDNNVPVLLILDEVEDTNQRFKKIILDKSCYSFRFKIEFDISDTTSVISPEIDFIECHIKERDLL